MRRAGLCWLTVCLAVSLPGCGRPSYPLAEVRGRVIYRGRGVSKATVQLLADSTKGTHAPTASGETGADGSFTLQTPPHGAGAVPGHYKVTVQHYHSALPAKYGNPADTPLRVEVPAGGLADWKVQLED